MPTYTYINYSKHISMYRGVLIFVFLYIYMATQHIYGHIYTNKLKYMLSYGSVSNILHNYMFLHLHTNFSQ